MVRSIFLTSVCISSLETRIPETRHWGNSNWMLTMGAVEAWVKPLCNVIWKARGGRIYSHDAASLKLGWCGKTHCSFKCGICPCLQVPHVPSESLCHRIKSGFTQGRSRIDITHFRWHHYDNFYLLQLLNSKFERLVNYKVQISMNRAPEYTRNSAY